MGDEGCGKSKLHPHALRCGGLASARKDCTEAPLAARCAQDNLYRLGLLTHLQSGHVPLKVPECLRDLRAMYEAATVDDVHDAYAHFEMDDDHVFTCVGTSGPQPPAQPASPPPALSQGVCIRNP